MAQQIWNVDTGECLHVLDGHEQEIYSVAFDGVRVVSGGMDTTVRVWDAMSGSVHSHILTIPTRDPIVITGNASHYYKGTRPSCVNYNSALPLGCSPLGDPTDVSLRSTCTTIPPCSVSLPTTLPSRLSSSIRTSSSPAATMDGYGCMKPRVGLPSAI